MGFKKLTIAQILPEMDSGGVEMVTLDFGSFLAQKGHRSLDLYSEGIIKN